ncbi:substrate-binding domain-containing protein [Arthrobacter sp. M4]|uniref:substrate-binding domain-containing protein n=1 Tax=Arthrobacter sp. M4 TaxID=218160 RepID=UPI001CDD4B75|nr:substrate-binding domain-containing protein [Arthrobacter sp. M4]MCA4133189.1 substrate-binding domain-containing protein [Arthrobacter sp. M4]
MPEPESNESPSRAVLRVAYVPGVTPGKWIRRWEERMPGVPLEATLTDEAEQLDVLLDGSADISFVRFPVEREGLHVIPLYEEQPAVAAAKGHEITVFEEVDLADLAEETFLDVAEMGGADMALQVAASGAGLVVLPMPVARHLNNKDTVARRLLGAEPTQIGVAWLQDATDHVIEEFIGIVRGRTARSSRQPSQAAKAAGSTKKSGQGNPAQAKSGAKKSGKSSVPQRYAPNPDKGRGRGSRKKGRR